MALASVSSRMSFTRSRVAAGSCSYLRPAMKAASSAVTLIRAWLRNPSRLWPFHDLGLDERREFFGCGDRGLCGEAHQALAHVGHLVDLGDRGMDLLRRRLWNA